MTRLRKDHNLRAVPGRATLDLAISLLTDLPSVDSFVNIAKRYLVWLVVVLGKWGDDRRR